MVNELMQTCTLSPLEVVTKELQGLPWELLYTDDSILIAESAEIDE